MSVRNIFIEKNVLCPVCKNTIPFKYPNPKLYAVARRDADRRVTAYTWAQGLQTTVVPHYYAVCQCPQCLFADLKENLENPKNSSKDHKVYKERNNLDFKRVMILKKLHRMVPGDELSLDAAIAMHLAAIFIWLLPGDEDDIDHNKLGRLYLRLSWLYREKKGDTAADQNGGDSEGDSPSLNSLFHTVENMQSTCNTFSSDLGSIRNNIRDRAEELGLPREGEQNPYWPLVAAISDKAREMQTLIEMFQQSVISDKRGELKEMALASIKGGGNDQLLNIIAAQWPDMPTSEEVAVRRAVSAFDYSFKKEDTEHSIEQSLSVVNLIVKLLLKIGDIDGALNYASQIFKSGMRDKQELQRRLRQGKQSKTLSALDEKNILRKIGTINNSLSQAGETRKMIIQLIYEKQKDDILPILKANVAKTSTEQQQALLDAGFSDDLIPFLKERGLIKVEEVKKGWFAKKKA